MKLARVVKLPKPSGLKLAVFDMAGTVVQEGGAVYSTMLNTLEARGVRVQNTNWWAGKNKLEVLSFYCKFHDLDEVRAEFKERLFAAYETDLSLISGAEQTFERLKADGVSVALNTGYPKDVQERIVKMLNLDELVDDWISSEEVSYGRPSPNMLNELMLRFDTWPKDVIKVGDTRNDMLEGLNAHCGEIVGVLLTGEHDEKTLYGAGAHRVIDSIKVL